MPGAPLLHRRRPIPAFIRRCRNHFGTDAAPFSQAPIGLRGDLLALRRDHP